MPPVQLSVLNASIEDDRIVYKEAIKENTIDTIFLDLGNMVETCNVPSKEELMNSTIEHCLDWDQ
eukprot:14459546-Ditylum_brightwellii.AAC.1